MTTKKLETFHSATIKIECPMFDSIEERDAYLLAIRNLLCDSCISLVAWHHKGEEQQPWYAKMAGEIDIDGKKSNVDFLTTQVELLQDDDGSEPYLKEYAEEGCSEKIVFSDEEFRIFRRDLSLVAMVMKDFTCGKEELSRIISELDKKKGGVTYQQQVID